MTYSKYKCWKRQVKFSILGFSPLYCCSLLLQGQNSTYPVKVRGGFWGSSLVAQSVKNPPAMQEIPIQSLGQEDPWRRKWQPTAVFLPEKPHEQRSLAGYSPWGHKESDTTERLNHLQGFWSLGTGDSDKADSKRRVFVTNDLPRQLWT